MESNAVLPVKGVLQALPNLQQVFVDFSTGGQSLPSEVEDAFCEVMRHHGNLDVLQLGEKRWIA